MGSGTVCFSEPPSILIASTVQCFDVFLMRYQPLKNISVAALSVSELVLLSSFSHKGNVFGVGTLTTLLVFLSCWPLFTMTTKLHVMNNSGPCVGAEARPVLI